MKKLISILFISIFVFAIKAQVVTTDPAIFTADDAVTITFHADKGSAGLKDYTGDIYAHAGVITTSSANGGDWKHVIADWGVNTEKAKLTRVSANVYTLSITPSIKDFYKDVTDASSITKLAFVFRNADGSKTGKDSGDKDIFVDVSQPGLNIKINTPSHNAIYSVNDNISTSAVVSESSTLKLYINDVETKSISGTEISHSFTANQTGNYEIKYEASNGSETTKDSISVYVKGNQVVEELPAGTEFGINYINDNTVTLSLFAPHKENVIVIGDFNSWTLSEDYQMKKTSNDSIFWLTIDGLEAGKEYAFQYLIDGDIRVADPYTEKVLDPWNDKYIPSETYPDLKVYPGGKTDEITSVLQTAQTAYNWEVTNFTAPAKEDLVIYELHFRDFTQGPNGKEGNIKGALAKLDYLKNLGVNAIELMPINEFEGNDSWGYNPSFYFAPDKAYGTEEDYKEFIDECHKRGMAVLIDLVLNHSYGQSPFVRMYMTSDWKPTAQNPWYNQNHNFQNGLLQWGADFNHESKWTQKLVDRINKYWMTEYKVDGFRFDFTKGFGNNYKSTSSDEWGSNYDADRVRLLKRMYDEIKKVNSNAYVICEHLADNSEEKDLANYGIMLWGNMNHNYTNAAKGQSNDSGLSWGYYKSRGWNSQNLVTYMESHDEERMMFVLKSSGKESGSYDIKNLETALERAMMSTAFFLTIPGPKMIWQFGELGYDISINENGRVGKKPVKWEYFDVEARKRLYDFYAAFAKLKTEHKTVKEGTFTSSLNGMVKKISIQHADMSIAMVGNFDIKSVSAKPDFPVSGTWYDFVTNESINVTNATTNSILKPGEFKIYTTKNLGYINETPTSVDENISVDNIVNIYPNPVVNELRFSVDVTEWVEIYDVSARLILQTEPVNNRVEISELNEGVYFVKFKVKNGNTIVKKFLKK